MLERIGSLRMADSTRAEFDDSVTEHDLEHLAELPKVKTASMFGARAGFGLVAAQRIVFLAASHLHVECPE